MPLTATEGIAEGMQRSLSELRSTINSSDQNGKEALDEAVERLEQQAALLRENLKKHSAIETLLKYFKEALVPLLSLLAFGVSLFTLLLTFFWVKPDVRVIKGSYVELSYIPSSNELQVRVRFTLANVGRRMDIAEWTQGELSSAHSSTIYFPSRTGNVLLKEAGQQLVFPFTIAEQTAKDIDVRMSQKLGSNARNTFFFRSQPVQVSREQLLSLNVKLESNRNASAQFCFDVRDEVLADIEKGMTKEFTVMNCATR